LSEALRGSHPPIEAYGILNHSEVIPQLESLIRDGDILLIKGSHGMHLETVVRALEEKE
jgi:UDP-N-acetylmuramoyl-tripeptide--D-alanyl-D-alanine ligase